MVDRRHFFKSWLMKRGMSAGYAMLFILLGLVDRAKAQVTRSPEPTLQRAPGAGADQRQRLQPGQQTAAELDREAAAERAAERARQPEVAPGLRLPDESGVWALDTYKGTPELVRVRQSDGDLNLDTGHSVKAAAIPRGGARELIRLNGDRAAVTLHGRPVFYIALDVQDEPAAPGAMVMDTTDMTDTHGARRPVVESAERSGAASRYVLVRLRLMHGERVASAQELSELATGGSSDASANRIADVIATEQTVLPGGRWMRVTARADVAEGQYSLVELPGEGRWNADGWDFGVNARAPENRNALLPKQP